MRIRTVDDVPDGNGRGARGRWAVVWEQVERSGGKWVEVALDSAEDAYQLMTTATTHRTIPMEVHKRGLRVYLRKRL